MQPVKDDPDRATFASRGSEVLESRVLPVTRSIGESFDHRAVPSLHAIQFLETGAWVDIDRNPSDPSRVVGSDG